MRSVNLEFHRPKILWKPSNHQKRFLMKWNPEKEDKETRIRDPKLTKRRESVRSNSKDQQPVHPKIKQTGSRTKTLTGSNRTRRTSRSQPPNPQKEDDKDEKSPIETKREAEERWSGEIEREEKLPETKKATELLMRSLGLPPLAHLRLPLKEGFGE
ncbi:unnamed protein product [Musa hybrid cultivar]